jgi:hypothetical protein
MDAYRIEARIEHASISVERRCTVQIDDGRDANVTVAFGSIWLTQERDSKDVCLSAGESFRIERNGATLAYALAPSLLIVRPAGRPCGAMRVSMAARGRAEWVELFATGTPKRPPADRLSRFWISLFVPESRPTTAAL